MSKELVESILDKDFVLAESYFNDVLNNIMEKKLYEKKRMIAAQMDEALGGLSRAEIEMRKKAGYRKAADVLKDPRADIGKSEARKKLERMEKEKEKTPSKKRSAPKIDMSKERRIGEEALDEAGLGYGARVAHTLSPDEKMLFKSARSGDFRSARLGDIRSAIKLRRTLMAARKRVAADTATETEPTSNGSKDTAAMRNRAKAAKWANEYTAKRPPGTAGVKVGRFVKRVGKGILDDIADSIG